MTTPSVAAATVATFRRAVESDLPQVVALIAELSPSDPPMLLDRAREIFVRMQGSPHLSLWVAEVGGAVVGTYTMQVVLHLGHGGAPGAVVESVVVSRALRGQGIGEQMMRHAAMRAGEAGCYKVALSSNRKRPDAHRFYRRIGFRDHGVSFALGLAAP